MISRVQYNSVWWSDCLPAKEGFETTPITLRSWRENRSLLTQTINASKTDQNRKDDTATLIHYSLLAEASFPWYSAARRISGERGLR